MTPTLNLTPTLNPPPRSARILATYVLGRDNTMPQVTIYVDKQADQILAAAARSAGMSKSRWVAELIKRTAASHWPASLRQAAGAVPDFPLADELRRGLGRDIRRVRVPR